MANPSTVSETPFPLLLAHHYREGSTGTLLVHSPPHSKRIFLQEGTVIFAASDDRNDRLGEMLVRRSVLRLSDFLSASTSVRPGVRFGSILLERELLSPDQLVWAVKEQVKEIVFSLFDVSASACAFLPGAAAGEEIITLNINTPELLRIGIERFDRITPAMEVFQNTQLPLLLKIPHDEVAQHLKLEEASAGFLSLLAEPCTLDKLLDRSPLSDFSAIKLLWILWALGLLGVDGAGGPKPKAVEDEDLGITAEDLTGF